MYNSSKKRQDEAVRQQFNSTNSSGLLVLFQVVGRTPVIPRWLYFLLQEFTAHRGDQYVHSSPQNRQRLEKGMGFVPAENGCGILGKGQWRFCRDHLMVWFDVGKGVMLHRKLERCLRLSQEGPDHSSEGRSHQRFASRKSQLGLCFRNALWYPG